MGRFAVTPLFLIGDLNALSVFLLIDSGIDISILWKKKKKDQQESLNPSICLSCVRQMVLTLGNVQHLTRALCNSVAVASSHRVQSALHSADRILTASHGTPKGGQTNIKGV